MKFNELKNLKAADLKIKKKEITQSIFEATIKNQIGQLSNPLVIRQLRKDLARVNTALTQVLPK